MCSGYEGQILSVGLIADAADRVTAGVAAGKFVITGGDAVVGRESQLTRVRAPTEGARRKDFAAGVEALTYGAGPVLEVKFEGAAEYHAAAAEMRVRAGREVRQRAGGWVGRQDRRD